MAIAIETLLSFYRTPLGRMTRRLIHEMVRELSVPAAGRRVLALGYATPFLPADVADAERVMAFMPARQGVVVWPRQGPNRSVLVDPLEMPLTDASLDLVIAVHAFEHVADAEELMRELWRVTATDATLIVIAPRRRGLWAQRDNNPFGHGHPFSRSQLAGLLRDHSFSPEYWREALFLPPTQFPPLLRSARAFETAGRLFGSALAGVMGVQARRRSHPAVARRQRAHRLVRVPEGEAQPALPRMR